MGQARVQGQEQNQGQNQGQDRANAGDSLELSPEAQRMLESLKARDKQVRAHEAAHLAAGAGITKGGASYTTQRGPDGNMYAIGGEVPIDAGEVPGDPKATLAKAKQISAAALAPADPSPQDRAVAAAARQMAAQASAEIARSPQGEASETNEPEGATEENDGAAEDAGGAGRVIEIIGTIGTNGTSGANGTNGAAEVAEAVSILGAAPAQGRLGAPDTQGGPGAPDTQGGPGALDAQNARNAWGYPDRADDRGGGGDQIDQIGQIGQIDRTGQGDRSVRSDLDEQNERRARAAQDRRAVQTRDDEPVSPAMSATGRQAVGAYAAMERIAQIAGRGMYQAVA
jgi:hypothetical protein